MHPRASLDSHRTYVFRGGWRRTALRGAIAVALAIVAGIWPGITLRTVLVGACVYLFVEAAFGLRRWIATR